MTTALAALAAELPAALGRTVRPRLLVAAVLVVGSARRLRLLAVERFTELALGLVFLLRVRFGHDGSLTRTSRAWLVDLPLTRRHAVYVRDPQRQQHPPIGDHRLAELVPVRMFPGDVAIQSNQRLDGVVAGRGRRGRQFRRALGNGIRPSVVGIDQQRGTRVAAQVAGLGPGLGDRYPHGQLARIEVIAHVRQLWAPVTLDGGQHPEGVPTDHGQQFVVEDLASHAESLRRAPGEPLPVRGATWT